MAEIIDILKGAGLFSGVDAESLAKIVGICRFQDCRAGEVIFEEGAESTALYILPEGRVGIELKLFNDTVTEQIYQARDQEVFGEVALIDGHRRSARTRALDNLSLVVIDREQLLNLMNANPVLGYCVMTNLARLVAGKLRDTNMSLRNVLMQQKYALGDFA